MTGLAPPRVGRRREYLRRLGVTVWVARDAARPGAGEPRAAAGPVPEHEAPEHEAPEREAPEHEAAEREAPEREAPAPGAAAPGGGDLEALRAEVAGCTRCALHAGRSRTVFGVGAPGARCMVVGEAPGAEEDRRGEPFVGRAGRLLDAMLLAAGLPREAVYIANIVKCRPPSNRDPRPEEVASCAAYLRRQIELVGPRVLLAAGRVAAQSLLGSGEAVGRLRGRAHRYEPAGIPVVVTYHPAYLLRSPLEKRKVWADLRALRRVLEGAR